MDHGEEFVAAISELQSSNNSTAPLPAKLKRVTGSKSEKYQAELAKFCLFRGRLYELATKWAGDDDAQATDWQNHIRLPLEVFWERVQDLQQQGVPATMQSVGTDIATQATSAIRTMILLAIDLKGQHTFGEIVSSSFTSMDVYVRCRSIKTNLGENDGIHFQAQCASTVHRASAALQFGCRLGTVGVLLLANQANHKELQGAYRDTTQLSQSNTMMNLAYISSVCRSYEHELQTGGAKAQLGYSDLNPTVPSVVTILDKNGQTLTLTRQQLVRGHGKLLEKLRDHIEEVIEMMLDNPPSPELCNELASLQHLPFGCPGTSRADSKLILMESLLSAKPHVHGSHNRSSDLVYGHSNGGNELRVHMFSAVFPIRVVGSSATREIRSADMRRWIGAMAQKDPRVAVQLCEAHNAMVDLLCTRFTFPFRGIARPHEFSGR